MHAQYGWLHSLLIERQSKAAKLPTLKLARRRAKGRFVSFSLSLAGGATAFAVQPTAGVAGSVSLKPAGTSAFVKLNSLCAGSTVG